MNYFELRRNIKQQSDALPSDHPCRNGNGRCCNERDIPVTPSDERYIAAGIRSGKISAETVFRARKNAKDSSVGHCPFLGPDKKCTIYEFRPIVCVVTGIGAKPNDPAKLQAENYHMKRTGEDRGFPSDSTQSCMCKPCHLELNKKEKRFSISGMMGMQDVFTHLAAEGTKSIIVALRSFPNTERKKRRK
jgi:hypothetical protein